MIKLLENAKNNLDLKISLSKTDLSQTEVKPSKEYDDLILELHEVLGGERGYDLYKVLVIPLLRNEKSKKILA